MSKWPETYKMLAEAHVSTAALRIAEDQLAKRVREVSDNWSPQIKEYLESTNINQPAPWCAAFVYWCAGEAASLVDEPNPFRYVELPALVQSYYKYARDNDMLVEPRHVGLGDIFMLWFPDRGRYAHMGFVQNPNADGARQKFTTVEGNTNRQGGREGTMVASRTRPYSDRYKFIGW